MRAGQRASAIFTMCKWQSLSIFAPAEPASPRSSFDCRDGGIAEDNFCRFVGHAAEATKCRAARLSQKEQADCPDGTDCNHGHVVADKVWINHQGDAEEHRFPEIHSLSVDEG